MSLDRVGVVGAGLIGTSIGLALARSGQQALLADLEPARATAAAALGAGRAVSIDAMGECDHVVVAVPPAQTLLVIAEVARRTVDATVSDVASVKARLAQHIETVLADPSRYCGGHPIAGRERGGPGAARATLFDGAVWAVTPLAGTSAAAEAAVVELARRCGARPLRVSPDEHDAVLAVVSHAPQLVASALAAQLLDAGPLAPALAGTGFRDTTRLADSDPELWTEIAEANAAPLAGALDDLARSLRRVATSLSDGDPSGAGGVLRRGRLGRSLLPGKHSAAERVWTRVGVVLPDRPGELGRLLTATGEAGVNVEDVSIDHAAEHPFGYVVLDVRPEVEQPLLDMLRRSGWAAYPEH